MNRSTLLSALFTVVSCAGSTFAQTTTFDVNAYQQFLATHRVMAASELRAAYPAGIFAPSVVAQPAQNPYLDSITLKYSLTTVERDLLAKNGFVVTSRLAQHTFMEGFGDVYNKDLPIFVSSDAILQAVHNSYDNILKDIEKTVLHPELISALTSLHGYLPLLHQRYGADERMAKMLRDVDTYVTVPLILLGKPVSPYFADNAWWVQSLLQAIQDQQPRSIPLFAETERRFDFSQFAVRGHYTKDTLLARYFRAMMWLGRTDFFLTAPEGSIPPWPEADIQRQLVDAALIAEASSESGALPAIQKIDRILRFLVGESDNVVADSILALNAEAGIQSPAELLDTTRARAYQALLLQKEYSAQRILSQIFITDPFTPEQLVLPSTFLLLGQRFVIDSYICGNVVYDKILYEGNKVPRMLPSTLDILFALGNNAASQLIGEQIDAYHYGPNLAALRYLVDSYGEDFWKASLFNAWLQIIRALNPPDTRKEFPSFMQTAAWWQEKMNTQLGSWAQLRHDNLLYAKQSYTVGIICSYPSGYVEPIPSFYEAVKGYAEVAQLHLAPLGIAGMAEYFDRLAGVADTLGSIARNEISGTSLSEAEVRFLQSTLSIHQMCGAPYTGWYPELYYKAEFVPHDTERKTDFVVVDFHTTPTDAFGSEVGWVLHAGTGPVDMAIVNATLPGGGPCTFVGPVMNYYEHLTSNFKRLTDEEWATLYNVSPTLRPDFVNCYLADETGGSRGPGPMLLTGVVATPPEEVPTTTVLFQNYPNPFNSSTAIAFSLPHTRNVQYVTLDIFDVRGARIARLVDEPLPGGNYVTYWEGLSASGLPVASGVYLYRLSAGDRSIAKKLAVVR